MTVDEGLVAVPFYLDDGTGRALVDVPDGIGDESAEMTTEYDVSYEHVAEAEFEDAGDQPPTVAPFLTEHTDASPSSRHKRKYHQRTLPIRTDLLVFGDAELAERADTAADPSSNLVVTEDEDTEMFLVTDRSEAELARSLLATPILVVLGVLLTVGGLWWLLSIIGV